MKLAKRSTIQAEIAEETKHVMEDGLKLRRAVDRLRLDKVNLEEQQKLFIENTRIALEESVKELRQEIREKSDELTSIEERRKTLLEPLDKEWEKVKSDREFVNTRMLDVGKSISTYNLAIEKLKDKQKEVNDTASRIKSRERELLKVYTRAEENAKETAEILREIQKEREVADKSFAAKLQELYTREAELASKEREIESIKRNLSMKEEGLNKREILIFDREATLEREYKRLKNVPNSNTNTKR